MSYLFGTEDPGALPATLRRRAPQADRMRPRTLDQYVASGT
ncbi:MAG: hypothetical protein R3E96_04100 [Planctomycetota bacterium]